MGLKQMIKKLGTKYRIKCIIGAVIFAAIGISGVAAAMGVDEGSIWIGLGSAMFLAFAAWFIPGNKAEQHKRRAGLL